MTTINLRSSDFVSPGSSGFHPCGSSIRQERKVRSVVVDFSSPAKLQNLSSQHSHRKANGDTQEISHHLHIAPSPGTSSDRSTEFQFDKLQELDGQVDSSRLKRVFGRYVAREAILDEDYWTAAWLRAENQYEDQPGFRYVNSYKKKYAEQEFTDLKRRCAGHLAQKCTCIVTVKQERDAKRTILNSIVGTLDLSIEHLLPGECFPGKNMKKSGIRSVYESYAKKYGYIANLCVAKFARRQGIATNMLYLAIEAAKRSGCMRGVEQVFIHVDRKNKHAQELYRKVGFQRVETATPSLLAEQQHLMCLDSEIVECLKSLKQDF